MLKNYWLVAIRKLWKDKAHTAINILGLTIGIAACLIIYLLTRFELGTDRFHPGGDRIYRVVMNVGDSVQQHPTGGLTPALPVHIQDGEIRGLETVAPFYTWSTTVTIPGKEERKFDRPTAGQEMPFVITNPGYFSTFDYQWLAGTPAASLREPFAVVLSEKEMTRYFGPIDPDQAIGRQVIYQDSLRTTVTGIVKDWGQSTDFGFTDFISLATVPRCWLKGDDFDPDEWHYWTTASQALVRLDKGVTPGQVEAQFPALLKKYLDPTQHGRLSLQSLFDIHFNEAWPDEYSRKVHKPTLYGLMGIAVFILLLAVVNFVNLSTARSMQRAREVGIRKVLGSRRRDIIFQFLGETFLLTLLAVGLSLLITPPVIALAHDWLPPGLRLDYSFPTLAFVTAITVITALLAGWFPAKFTSALRPVLSLKGQAAGGLAPKRYLHRALIVFQFTISLVFIICAVVVARQLHFVLNSDLGFDKDAILTVRPTGKHSAGQLQVLAQKISTLPGVSLVARGRGTPQAARFGGTGLVYHGATDQKVMAQFELCDPAYIPLFGLHLVAGANMAPGDTLRDALVNETCAKALGFLHPRDALGKAVETGFGGRTVTITGVVKDFHFRDLHEVIKPFFFATNSNWLNAVSVRLSPDDRSPDAIRSLLAGIGRLWPTVFPDQRFTYSFFDDDIAKLYENDQKTSGLLRLAMCIAIFISCMGLLGLATFAAEQRSKEVGIRKVLGASVIRIVSLMSLDFLWPVALAIVIATPVAWYFMHEWLQDFAYRTTVPWWIIACCGLAAIVIAVLTVGYHALRAATANPVDSLRSE